MMANNIDNVRQHMSSYLGSLQKSNQVSFSQQEVSCCVIVLLPAELTDRVFFL